MPPIHPGRSRRVTVVARQATDPPDLEAVDELCRLALAAGRLGCRVLLVDVTPALHDLLVLAGVDELLHDRASDRSDLP